MAVTDKYNSFTRLLSECPDIDTVVRVDGGKLRRYPNENLLVKLTDLRTMGLNLRDAFRLLRGIVEARKLIKTYKPDTIFIKGGIVGVPVGIAAKQKRVPFITHDSDTKPGLTSRAIGRWAYLHAVGMPEKFYSYPRAKTSFVGIPVSRDYRHVSPAIKRAAREKLGLPSAAKVIFVTGGSQGAQRLNSIIESARQYLGSEQDIFIIHQTGKSLAPLKKGAYWRFQFAQNLYEYTAAADVVVARAGANTIAELAVQGKALIVVPSPYLAGGHQVSNAVHLSESGAAIYLKERALEQRPEELRDALQTILSSKTILAQLERNLGKLAVPDSATRIAELILRSTKP